MAMQSSILAWKIPWREEPGRRSQWGHKESDMTEQLSTHTCPSNILDLSLSSLLPFFFFLLFFWPCCEATLGLSSPTRDQTHTPCIGSTES